MTWAPIKTAPHNEVFMSRCGEGYFALLVLIDEPGIVQFTKRWPWSKPEKLISRDAATYVYYALPGNDGYYRMLVKRSDDEWEPTEWAPLSDLPK